jgi:hypothetical protein
VREVSVVRVGDRLAEPAEHQLKPHFEAAQNLAKAIFSERLDDDKLLEYYIQTPPHPMERDGGVPPGCEADTRLGQYESRLLWELGSDDSRVVPIVGGMGCGKTTVIRFILNRLKSIPCQEDCSNGESCNGDRLIAYLNFDQKDYPRGLQEEKVRDLLNQDLATALSAKLTIRDLPSGNDELARFWDEELRKLGGYETQSTAFAAIAAKLREQGVRPIDARPVEEPLPDDELERRTQLRNAVCQDPRAHLDYLVRLWGFVARQHFGGRGDCALVVLDNVDGQEPIVQYCLLSIVAACARDDGPTFLIPLRPETLERHSDAAGAPKPLYHVAPLPREVVMDRLRRFTESADSFHNEGFGLEGPAFDIIKSFLCSVFRELEESVPPNTYYLDFLDRACGQSLRLALLYAQKLLTLSQHSMQTGEYSQHTLIRFTIRKPGGQYEAQEAAAPANLFHVKRERYGRFTAKPRILLYLKLAEDHVRTLGEIAVIMDAFGHRRTTVTLKALNEMQKPWCQLIRSTRFDSYTERDMSDPGDQLIKLSPMGEGYVDHLLTNIDYVQEVMLDCYVRPSCVGTHVPYIHLSDKLDLLYKFLNEIRLADREETEYFLQERSRQDYLDLFGSHLLSFEMIAAMRRSMDRLADYMIRLDRVPSRPYAQVKESMKDLLLLVAGENHRLLGIYPRLDLD